MFYHLVMMRLTPEADEAFHRRVHAFAQRVHLECDGVVQYNYCGNVAARAGGFGHVVASVFESSQAHDRYQVSPVHVEMKNFMMPFIADLVVFDGDAPWKGQEAATHGRGAPA